MAKAARKKSPGRPKKAVTKKSATKKSATKKAAKKAAPKKKPVPKKSGSAGKNKLGVKNSLVNNINAKKKKGTSKPKRKSTVSGKSYNDMQNDWK